MLGGLIGEGEFVLNFGSTGNWLGSVNLKDIFTAAFPGVTGPVRAVFTQFGNVGATNRSFALRTGGWDAGSEVVLKVNLAGVTSNPATATDGLILGAGQGANGNPGCTAIVLDYNLTLVNNGIIGGGGGAGSDRGGPDGNGGGGAGYPSGGPSEGSSPGDLFNGGGGSGGSGAGGGLGKAMCCGGSYFNRTIYPAIATGGWTYTFDPASTKPWFAGNPAASTNICNPITTAGDRNGGVNVYTFQG